MRIFSLALVLLLAGCAAQGGTWVKPGANQATFEQEKYGCLIDSKNGVGGYDARVFNACMAARGYSLQ